MVACFERGRQRWPTLSLTLAEFVEYVTSSNAGNELLSEELYLACACGLRRAGAAEILLQTYGPLLRRSAQRLALSDDEISDLVQLTFQVVLVGGNSLAKQQRPSIVTYRGRGSLEGWLRTVMVRCHKPRRKEQPLDEVGDRAMVQSDVELQLLRQRYGPVVHESLKNAMRSLEVDERRLLRQHHLDAVSIDKLARLLKVHRATAARRVARIREKLLQRMRLSLQEQLNLGPHSLESLERAIRADLDSSIVGALESQ